MKAHTAEVSDRSPTNALEPGLWAIPPVPNPTKELAIPLASFFPFPTRTVVRRYGATDGRRGSRHDRSTVAGTKPATAERTGAELGRRSPASTGHGARGQASAARSAAFFDLDRTLLSGASGPAISAALRTVGLVSDRASPART